MSIVNVFRVIRKRIEHERHAEEERRALLEQRILDIRAELRRTDTAQDEAMWGWPTR